MSQPIVAQSTSIVRIGQLLKIKDLYEESNLRNNIDIIAVIAKVGDLKLATQSTKVSVPAREIYLCDDSWAMIKLIARDYFAENKFNFHSNQIIFIKNVKPMKLRGYIVLATMPDTIISPEVNTLEAISMRCWLSQNSIDFNKTDGVNDLLLKRFANLSSLGDKNPLQGPAENLVQNSQSPIQSITKASASQINNANSNNTIDLSLISERKRKCSDADSNAKLIKIDLTIDPTKPSEIGDSTTISDAATQKFDLDNSKKDSNVSINISSDDENLEKKIVNVTIKKEVLEKEDNDKEDNDIDVVDDDKDLIISETFSALMSVQSPLNKWNMEKDKYLINFISKHCTKQLTDDMFAKLFQANSNIFQDLSIHELKNRAETLATAKNYIYLLQLCGGKEIKTEKEKCLFVDRVEYLRKLMRTKEIKTESCNS